MPIPAKPVENCRSTAKERVFKTLQQWIIDGTLFPGERLNDVELASYFSVSRTPVREALQMLCEEKLVYVVPSSGTYVSEIDLKDMAYVYQLLTRLQVFAVELCMPNVTAEDLQFLTDCRERVRASALEGDPKASEDADFQFHHRLAEMAGNPYLTAFTDKLMLQVCRNELHFFQTCSDPEESYEGHTRIIEALREKRLAEAQAAVQENWQTAMHQRALEEAAKK